MADLMEARALEASGDLGVDPAHTTELLASRVRGCRIAFVLAAVGLGIQTFDLGLSRVIAFLAGGPQVDPAVRRLAAVVTSPEWGWWVGTPITWCALVATLLLVGRFRTPTWNARVLPLLLMNSIDLGLWLLEHASSLGLGNTLAGILPGNSLLRIGLESLQWLELILFASLCAELGQVLGHKELEASQHAARASAVGGLVVWGLTYCILLLWALHGFQGIGRADRIRWLLFHSMAQVMLAITAFQVTVLCATAARRCREWLERSGLESDAGPAASGRDPILDDWRKRDAEAWK